MTDAGRIAVLYAAACAAVAAIVATTLAQPARQWLHLKFEFAHFHSSLADAAAIFAHNLPTLLELLAAAAVAQLAAFAATARSRRRFLVLCDLVGVQVLALNAVTVGAAVGAYGSRTVAALLPHGIVEIATFALAGGVYLRSRRGPVTLSEALPPAALTVVMLAAAALLEEVH